uniref:Uncharacterized protein n=1 Tax=Glossina palpalis gambiensis TaxID=67801 RepID=A0A1B0ASQ0_9MUSC
MAEEEADILLAVLELSCDVDGDAIGQLQRSRRCVAATGYRSDTHALPRKHNKFSKKQDAGADADADADAGGADIVIADFLAEIIAVAAVVVGNSDKFAAICFSLKVLL